MYRGRGSEWYGYFVYSLGGNNGDPYTFYYRFHDTDPNYTPGYFNGTAPASELNQIYNSNINIDYVVLADDDDDDDMVVNDITESVFTGTYLSISGEGNINTNGGLRKLKTVVYQNGVTINFTYESPSS